MIIDVVLQIQESFFLLARLKTTGNTYTIWSKVCRHMLFWSGAGFPDLGNSLSSTEGKSLSSSVQRYFR